MQNLFSLKNRVAVVTGASGLLGPFHCLALARAGASVVVTDLKLADCQAVFRALPKGDHLAIDVDVTSRSTLTRARTIILEKYGQIDVLVNNAAINDKFEDPAMATEQSMFENFPVEMWQRSIDVNQTGLFLASQAFGTPMAERRKGSIINIASTYGMVGPDQSIYVKPDGNRPFFKTPSYPATKGAVINFTRYLAAYWGLNGVRVNSLSPGGVYNGQEDWFVENYSQQTALGRMANPSDYQGAVVFLASDASNYMTGANLVVDGGWTCM
ncbi:MAG: SDR family oxidoreductase [Bacteroidota bacterium]